MCCVDCRALCAVSLNVYSLTISDFFDGDIVSSRSPPGPSDGWFTDVWKRDFPLLKQLGVNTLRLYSTNPTTLQV